MDWIVILKDYGYKQEKLDRERSTEGSRYECKIARVFDKCNRQEIKKGGF